MIWESADWKESLLHSATWLRRKRFTKGTRESTFVKIEKELLVGFYSIRKLLDAYKVSDTTKSKVFEITIHPNLKPVNYINWHNIDRLYDLKHSTFEKRNIRYICDRFIHSFVFLLNEKNDKIGGFYVATDYDRNKKLYYISLDTVIKIFRLVGRDYPSSMTINSNQKTGDLDITSN